MITIVAAQSAADLQAASGLFRAYAASLPIDLGYQDFERELAGLPGAYAPPGGALFLARAASGEAVGCAGLRPLQGARCEMKRLYVAPAGRGGGTGRALAEAVIGAAERAGYAEIVLDTLASMGPAQALYRQLGFVETTAYYPTPVADTVFMCRKLGK